MATVLMRDYLFKGTEFYTRRETADVKVSETADRHTDTPTPHVESS